MGFIKYYKGGDKVFKTLEEANEWKLEQEKKMQELNTAYEGLQNKLGETEASLVEKQKEIDGLKIKKRGN